LQAVLLDFAKEFDSRFREYLSDPKGTGDASILSEAVTYAALAPGKRIRPFLVVRCCELVGKPMPEMWPAAAAIECVHAFSLVHDDLPAMDDDDWRRGRLTCHKKFGEAIAILAGDALLATAFEILAKNIADGLLASRLVLEMAQGTGLAGMIGGQAADILGEQDAPRLELVQRIHEKKTARLFESACRMGAMVGRADIEMIDRLGRFGSFLGRSFQIADDLLDVTAPDPRRISGKNPETSAKLSYPACVGMEQSRSAARAMADQAVALLEPFGTRADGLRELGRFVVERGF
jgi:geranylgeranyl pyrophosphate synthase